MKKNYDKDIYKHLAEVMARCDRLEEELSTVKAQHREEIAVLKAENAILRVENQLLRDDNERMKRILNNDSNNSSMPPSSDQKGSKVNTYNGRTKSQKSVGGQVGRKGVTLTKSMIEEKIKKGECEHKIIKKGKGKVYKSRYVIDLEIRTVVREYRFYADSYDKISIPRDFNSEVIYGNMVKAIAVDLYSQGVMANDRIRDFINDISNNTLQLSEGSVYNFCKNFSELNNENIEKIKSKLLNSEVVYTDATVVTTNGKQSYIRNQSNNSAVLYSSMEKKNRQTHDETGILKDYCGTLIHDHETVMYHFGTSHAECNVHALRYLRKNKEETGNTWSEQLILLLISANERKKELHKDNKYFSVEEKEEYHRQWDKILSAGFEENKQTKGKYAKQSEKTLLNRLKTYKLNHLLFLEDSNIGFDNNMSERDLRKCKTRQKVAGGFRKLSGSEMYCSILSIIETCKRQGLCIFHSIQKIFNQKPLFTS